MMRIFWVLLLFISVIFDFIFKNKIKSFILIPAFYSSFFLLFFIEDVRNSSLNLIIINIIPISILILFFSIRTLELFNIFKYGKETTAIVQRFYSERHNVKQTTYFLNYMIYTLKDDLSNFNFKDLAILKENEDLKGKKEHILAIEFNKNGMAVSDFENYAKKEFIVCYNKDIKKHFIKGGNFNILYNKIL